MNKIAKMYVVETACTGHDINFISANKIAGNMNIALARRTAIFNKRLVENTLERVLQRCILSNDGLKLYIAEYEFYLD